MISNLSLQESEELLKKHNFLDKIDIVDYEQSNQNLSDLFSGNNSETAPLDLSGTRLDRLKQIYYEESNKVDAEIKIIRERSFCNQYFNCSRISPTSRNYMARLGNLAQINDKI